jgi:hypothetical protein
MHSALSPVAMFRSSSLLTNAGLDENRIQQGFPEKECSDRLAFQGQDAADGGNQISTCR